MRLAVLISSYIMLVFMLLLTLSQSDPETTLGFIMLGTPMILAIIYSHNSK